MLIRISSVMISCWLTPFVCFVIDFRPPIMSDVRSYFVLSVTLLLILGVPFSTIIDTFLTKQSDWVSVVLGRALLYPLIGNLLLVTYYSYHGFLLANWARAPFNYLILVVAFHSFLFAVILQMLERIVHIFRTIKRY